MECVNSFDGLLLVVSFFHFLLLDFCNFQNVVQSFLQSFKILNQPTTRIKIKLIE